MTEHPSPAPHFKEGWRRMEKNSWPDHLRNEEVL